MARPKRQKRFRTTRPGFEPVANPGLARWMHQLASSSAADRQTPRPFKGTRGARERQAIQAQD